MPASTSSQRYRHNGKLRIGWRDCDAKAIPSCLSVFVDLYRHHATIFARYSAEARCSPRQLQLIEALYIEGVSLREFAATEGTTPQAISSRINALANKAPEFYRWWRRLNASHQRPRKEDQKNNERKRD